MTHSSTNPFSRARTEHTALPPIPRPAAFPKVCETNLFRHVEEGDRRVGFRVRCPCVDVCGWKMDLLFSFLVCDILPYSLITSAYSGTLTSMHPHLIDGSDIRLFFTPACLSFCGFLQEADEGSSLWISHAVRVLFRLRH
jgi:hypothetical protein